MLLPPRVFPPARHPVKEGRAWEAQHAKPAQLSLERRQGGGTIRAPGALRTKAIEALLPLARSPSKKRGSKGSSHLSFELPPWPSAFPSGPGFLAMIARLLFSLG